MCYCTADRRAIVCPGCAPWLAMKNAKLLDRLASAESAAALLKERAEAAEARLDELIRKPHVAEITQKTAG